MELRPLLFGIGLLRLKIARGSLAETDFATMRRLWRVSRCLLRCPFGGAFGWAIAVKTLRIEARARSLAVLGMS